MADSKTTPEPCPICQGTGTRGQMTGERMAVVDCEPCEGTGRQPQTTAGPLDGKTRKQIIDAWMEDKLFLQGQVKRLRRLAAIAINQVNGPTIFDGEVSGERLRKAAIKTGDFAFDELHHAPACPANHYHHMRLPIGGCTCGAQRMQDA